VPSSHRHPSSSPVLLVFLADNTKFSFFSLDPSPSSNDVSSAAIIASFQKGATRCADCLTKVYRTCWLFLPHSAFSSGKGCCLFLKYLSDFSCSSFCPLWLYSRSPFPFPLSSLFSTEVELHELCFCCSLFGLCFVRLRFKMLGGLRDRS